MHGGVLWPGIPNARGGGVAGIGIPNGELEFQGVSSPGILRRGGGGEGLKTLIY